MDLQGKVAIVTGSATGIGRAVAVGLAERGCHVVVNYTRSEAEAKETADEIEKRKTGAEAVVVAADVAIDADCRRMVADAIARWGRLDVLINNAGTTVFVQHDDLESLTSEAWSRIFDVNVKGAFQMARAAAPALKASGSGAIVNVSSTAAINGGGSSIAYAASKAALDNLTISLARVLGPEIRVNGVAPGFVETRWLEQGLGNRLESIRTHMKRSTPLRDSGRPEHIAQAIISVLTGMDWVTGQTIVADGGYLHSRQ